MVKSELERVESVLGEDKTVEKDFLNAGIRLARLHKALDLTECIEQEYSTHQERINQIAMKRREEVIASLEAAGNGQLDQPEVARALEKYTMKSMLSKERIDTLSRDLMKKRTAHKIVVVHE